MNENPIISNRNNTPTAEKKKAIAFIDYEYWFYTMKNTYQALPDLKRWYREMAEQYDLIDVYAFGTFGQPDLKLEVSRIRSITNLIISTDNDISDQISVKDVTDFIMLDFIYQKAFDQISNDTTFIIFTGDGHFQSVVRYLRLKRSLDVVVCGIDKSFSRQLADAAGGMLECGGLPDDTLTIAYEWIIRDLENVTKCNGSGDMMPTFTNVTAAVATKSGLSRESAARALSKLIADKYITQVLVETPSGTPIKTLVPDWDQLYTLTTSLKPA